MVTGARIGEREGEDHNELCFKPSPHAISGLGSATHDCSGLLVRRDSCQSDQLGEGRSILFPPAASIDGRAGAAWERMTAALAVLGDHAVDDVPAVEATKSRDPGSPLADDLRHSQSGTTGTGHTSLLG